MNTMLLKSLSILQVCQIYLAHVTQDFPPEERKPLHIILRAIHRKQYECYGWMNGKKLLGYAFFVTTGNHRLLDYFAVVPALRGQGVGSAFCRAIADSFSDAQSILAEVENPDSAETEEEAKMQNRRLQFYLRNGFADTGIHAETFGVDYRILEVPRTLPHTPAEIRRIYHAHYRASLPDAVFQKMVIVHDAKKQELSQID